MEKQNLGGNEHVEAKMSYHGLRLENHFYYAQVPRQGHDYGQ